MSDNEDMLINTAPKFLHIFCSLSTKCKCYLVTFFTIYPSASFFPAITLTIQSHCFFYVCSYFYICPIIGLSV